MKHTILGLLSTILASLIYAPLGADEAAVPDEFEIITEFYSGSLSMLKCETAISDNGKVVQKYVDDVLYEDTERKFSVDKSSIINIKKSISKISFFELPSEIFGDGEDQPTVKITVKNGKKKHSVTIYGPNRVGSDHDKDVKKFYTLWNLILKDAPQPYK